MLKIRYSDGTVLQGILLALGDQKVRVAVKGSDDVAEYRLVHQRWISEDCEVVALEFADGEDPLAAAGEYSDGIVASGFDLPLAPHIM